MSILTCDPGCPVDTVITLGATPGTTPPVCGAWGCTPPGTPRTVHKRKYEIRSGAKGREREREEQNKCKVFVAPALCLRFFLVFSF